MSENLSFMVRVRDKGEITLPAELREKMKITTGTLLGIDIINNSQFHINKIVHYKMKNNKSGGNGESKDP